MGRLIDADKFLAKVRAEAEGMSEEWGYQFSMLVEWALDKAPTVDAVPVVHGKWEDGVCSVCKEEAFSTSWDENIYDYDWDENLTLSHIETHIEHHLTDFCPNCGAKMDLERSKDEKAD